MNVSVQGVRNDIDSDVHRFAASGLVAAFVAVIVCCRAATFRHALRRLSQVEEPEGVSSP
jgi:hypothetical protein